MPDLLTWIPFYQELANVLLSWQSRQTELIALLERLRADGHKVAPIEDQKADGSRFLLREIDPFTVFATFNRGLSGDNRRRLASPLGPELGCRCIATEGFRGYPYSRQSKSMTAPTSSISAAASISRSRRRRISNPAARASMAAATGCAWVGSKSASTACVATCRAHRFASGCNQV
jgi:hypothetical protein